MDNTYTLITGASKGIGKSMALECAKRSQNLILVARSEPELVAAAAEISKIYPVMVKFLAGDLTDGGFRTKLFEWCQNENLPVGILINNAGFDVWGDFSQSDINQQLNLIDLNIKALVDLTHKFLPQLKQQRKAHLLNVASLAGYYPIAYMSVYSASKAFVINFSRALRYELRSSSVKVSCLCPGSVATDFWKRNGMLPAGKDDNSGKMSAGSVAGSAISAMMRGKAVIVPGIVNKIYSPFLKLFPWLATRIYAYMIQP